jgi:TM2 domain-containing membrane protein YozV
MNCANHPDRERAAFCQHCGKPLCDDCVRKVGTSVYCEPCLAARVHGPAQPAGFPYAGYPAPGRPAGPPPAPGEPSPGLAALLGLIPGVGAMYNEQYGKGIVHLIVFAVLVSLSHDVGIFGLFVAGWMCYMVVEAYHTARARRDGTPLPNPFGLNDISERMGFGRAWPGNSPGAPPYAGAPSPDPDSSAQPAAGGRDPGAAASPTRMPCPRRRRFHRPLPCRLTPIRICPITGVFPAGPSG